MEVDADGEKLFSGKGLVFVGNISRYAVGLGVLSKADYGDGLLDVCIYKCESKFQLVKHSVKTVLKSHLYSKDVIYTRAENIKISSLEKGNKIKSEIDGDPGPDLPVEITVVPAAVKVLAPVDSKPAGIKARIARVLR